jgi:hypothetical protein
MESQILALKKAIGISNTNWYFKYQLVFGMLVVQIQQEQQKSGYKSSRLKTEKFCKKVP